MTKPSRMPAPRRTLARVVAGLVLLASPLLAATSGDAAPRSKPQTASSEKRRAQGSNVRTRPPATRRDPRRKTPVRPRPAPSPVPTVAPETTETSTTEASEPPFKLPEVELGAQLGYRLDAAAAGRRDTPSRFYLQARGEYALLSPTETQSSTLTLNIAARGFFDPSFDAPPAGSSNARLDAQLRALSLAWSRESVKLELGFQEIAWGETFGFYIADLVNPRDYRDPLLNDLSWIRLPVFALNAQAFLGPLTLQGVVTPISRNNLYPQRLGNFDPFAAAPALPVYELPSFELSRLGREMEFGGKASYLFDFGLDLGFLYYHHWSRNPVYELRNLVTTGPSFVAVQSQVDTLGLTASQTVESIVLRADALVSVNEPLATPGFATSLRGAHWQAIAGADHTTASDWTLGAQYHFDRNEISTRHWASARVSTQLARGKLVPEVFAFGGLNNPDLWVQPKLTWNVAGGLAVSLRADLILNQAPGDAALTPEGLLSVYRGEDRLLAWISWKL